MSIALSVVLQPSKNLQILRIVFSVCLLLVGIYIAIFALSSVYLKIVFAASCLIAALFNFIDAKAAAKNRWHILINPQGEIRCESFPIAGPSFTSSTELLQQSYYLAAGTVIWPQLLLLRLRRFDDDNMINLMILSDAISRDEFRRISVACRWIVAKTNSA